MSPAKESDSSKEEGKTIVRGKGNPHAEVFFIGEAPGVQEEKKGEPFVGNAGRVLNKELERNGLSRGDVYVSNVVKVRPPGNKKPTKAEINKWLPDVLSEIEHVRPRILVLLGKTAAEAILGRPVKLEEEYGKIVEIDLKGRRYDAMVCYHPASTFHSEIAKAHFKECIAKLAAFLRR